MSADTAPEPSEHPSDDAVDDSTTAESEAGEAGADEDLKAKYRDALAHKHSSHGATHSGHEDHGNAPRGHGPAQAQRMFRRKSGG